VSKWAWLRLVIRLTFRREDAASCEPTVRPLPSFADTFRKGQELVPRTIANNSEICIGHEGQAIFVVGRGRLGQSIFVVIRRGHGRERLFSAKPDYATKTTLRIRVFPDFWGIDKCVLPPA
jgi:hypothetical protein